MGNNIFYVKNVNNELIPAEFLQGADGQFIQDRNLIDVNPVNSRNGHYFDAVGNELVNLNPNNYLVVPINFDLQAAINFGKSLQGSADIYYQMTNAFIIVIRIIRYKKYPYSRIHRSSVERSLTVRKALPMRLIQ